MNTKSNLPSRSPVAATAHGHSSLAPLEIEIIDFFVQFSRALGQPKSVAELPALATRFLRDQIVPRLDDGLVRLERVTALARNLPAAERTRVHARMNMLHSWQKKTRRLALVVMKTQETAVGNKRRMICNRKAGQAADRTVFSTFQRTRFFRGPSV